jgi:short-subunit dehydrogenase
MSEFTGERDGVDGEDVLDHGGVEWDRCRYGGRGARRGAQLALVARSADKLESVAQRIREGGGNVTTHAFDVSDPEQVSRLAASLPTPDILFNNAGAGCWKRLVDTEPAEAAEMIGAPYLAAFYTTRAFLPAMLARRSGACLFMNSAASRLVWPGAAAYTATRWAVRGLFEAVRAETAGTGVRTAMATFAKVSSEYWANNPGSEENVPTAQAFVPVLTPEQVAEAILDGLAAEREEIIAPWQLQLTFLASRLFPGITRRQMRRAT